MPPNIIAPRRPLPSGSASVHFSDGWSYQSERAEWGADEASAASSQGAATSTAIRRRRAECIGFRQEGRATRRRESTLRRLTSLNATDRRPTFFRHNYPMKIPRRFFCQAAGMLLLSGLLVTPI